MLGAVACFACLDASAKWLNRTMDPLQTVSVRYIGSFLLGPVDVQREAMIAAARWMVAV